ncbi:MAG TPA: protein phosphatase 2C domain-containing protein [Polyangiaceae bacterium]
MTVDLAVCARTDAGFVRPANEDAFVIADLTSGCVISDPHASSRHLEVGQRGVLLAVSDGLGGHAAGEVASALVVESMRQSLSRSIPSEPAEVDELVAEAAQRANQLVWEAAAQRPGCQRMGATLTAVFVHGGFAHIAEVGDSRAYLLRDQAIEQITHDQSYLQLLIDRGVPPWEARRSPHSGDVLQAMGVRPHVTVALERLALRRGDCLILCSDGLSSKVVDAELRAAVQWARELDAACERMIDLALERGGDDNITAIVAGVSGDLPPVNAGERIADTLQIVQAFRVDGAR